MSRRYGRSFNDFSREVQFPRYLLSSLSRTLTPHSSVMPLLASPATYFPAFTTAVAILPRSEHKPFDNHNADDAIRGRLLRRGVIPTPKILHAVHKKENQKAIRKSKKEALRQDPPPLTDAQRQALEDDTLFRTAVAEYRTVRGELRPRRDCAAALPVEHFGRPWEGSKGVDLRRSFGAREDAGEGRLKGEHLEELKEVLAERNGERFRWLLDDDVEETKRFRDESERRDTNLKRLIGEEEQIKLLIERLHTADLDMQDWKFPRLVKQFDLFFNEDAMLKIVGGLGVRGNWRQALLIVEWVYKQKTYKHMKSRFVYTKLLSILGKARKPEESLQVFNKMREDSQLYPDMAAFHSVAVTLGQAGLVNELVGIIESMKQKPPKEVRNLNRRDWDQCLQPDVIIYNSLLNACIPSQQWRGVFWVLEQMRNSNIQPTGATYGLAMEVMLRAGKHEFVYKFFEKMQKRGLAPKALTYRVLVRALKEEGKVDEAVIAVRNMEERGVVAAASVYYELACCLCNNGRWQDAMCEIGKLKHLTKTKPLEVAFTGMILSSLDGGHINDCISIFEHMKDHCTPNIGIVNAMLKVYNKGDMFASAKKLFEATRAASSDLSINASSDLWLQPDAYSYQYMLQASAAAQQWEYFEHVYKEMTLYDYQLEQRRLVSLLVEASKAGKWHLLEHTIDRIIEADEVPHVLLFAALIRQTIAQQNYVRTATLLNSMAHASLKFSEDQWRNVLQEDMNRFGEDKVKDLLDQLETCDLVMEEPVPSFLKSLQYFGSKGRFSDSNCAGRSEVNGHKISVTKGEIFSKDAILEESDDNATSTSAAGVENIKTSFTDTAKDIATVSVSIRRSEMPSALKILEKWRRDRMDSGLSLNFVDQKS